MRVADLSPIDDTLFPQAVLAMPGKGKASILNIRSPVVRWGAAGADALSAFKVCAQGRSCLE
ncbi:hypothetical protein ACRS64_04420 [Pseudomonas aeruginosa]|uniref:hypothetical protein n=1 Tax=Pseudomonas aeruginosa TaxID=287 RepID=UPI003DA73B59